VLGVTGWVQGNGSRAVLPLTPPPTHCEAAAWPTAQASGGGCRIPLVTLRKEHKRV